MHCRRSNNVKFGRRKQISRDVGIIVKSFSKGVFLTLALPEKGQVTLKGTNALCYKKVGYHHSRFLVTVRNEFNIEFSSVSFVT